MRFRGFSMRKVLEFGVWYRDEAYDVKFLMVVRSYNDKFRQNELFLKNWRIFQKNTTFWSGKIKAWNSLKRETRLKKIMFVCWMATIHRETLICPLWLSSFSSDVPLEGIWQFLLGYPSSLGWNNLIPCPLSYGWSRRCLSAWKENTR